MTSPLSLVISAFARVEDVRHTAMPASTEDNALLLIDLGKGHNALRLPANRFTVNWATDLPMCVTSRS